MARQRNWVSALRLQALGGRPRLESAPKGHTGSSGRGPKSSSPSSASAVATGRGQMLTRANGLYIVLNIIPILVFPSHRTLLNL
jgi:hypothetical protein